MKLLFLDIDGVLNDHSRFPNRYSGIHADKVQRLNRILAELPDLQIVLSSAWRYSFDNQFLAQQILCVHGVDCFERVHGVTALDPVPEDHPSYDDREWWDSMGLRWRKEQIEEYVAAHQPDRFAVVDDLPLGVACLFKTDGNVGLTEEICAQVIEHFSDSRFEG